ncbi:hypothetical protein EV424DRAFT_1596682 [Suillus variegatus]|nr:hypothetical protein EV424DRAFT_1596682 [Suillus variegatus]
MPVFCDVEWTIDEGKSWAVIGTCSKQKTALLQVTYVPYPVVCVLSSQTLLATHTLWLLYLREEDCTIGKVCSENMTFWTFSQKVESHPIFSLWYTQQYTKLIKLEYKLQEKSDVAIIKRIELTKRLPRCREVILAKQRQLHKEKKSCQDNEPSDDEDEPMETLQDCIATVKYAKDDFMTYVKAPRRFFDLLVDEYSKTMPDPEVCPTGNGDKSVFERAITSLEDFLDQANRGLDGILQMCGACEDETEAPVGHITLVKMRERLKRLTVHNCRLRTDKLINFLFFVLSSTHNGDMWDELAATGSNGGMWPSQTTGSNGGMLPSRTTGSNGGMLPHPLPSPRPSARS